MATQTPDMTKPFKAATEAFQTAMESGLKFQQETINMVKDMTRRNEGVEDFQRRFETLANETADVVQKNADTTGRLFEENLKVGQDFFNKAYDAMTKNDPAQKDYFKQGQDVLQDAFSAFQQTTESIARTNTRMIENWSAFVNKAMGVADKKPAAAK